MDLLIVRHAIAMERSDWNQKGKPDQTRPLTEEGIKKFKGEMEQFKKIVPKIDLIISSEFTRAAQTAKILADHYEMQFFQHSFLNHGTKIEEAIQKLERFRADTLCLIGHEPDLSQLVQALIKMPAPLAELKKGGALLIEDPFGKPLLKWKITPKILRA